MGVDEVRRYMETFPRSTDYNLVDYGNMRVYYDDIRDFFEQCGYPQAKQLRERFGAGKTRGEYLISNNELWSRYKSITRTAAIAYTNAN